jgi:hypothetical protein
MGRYGLLWEDGFDGWGTQASLILIQTLEDEDELERIS